ncbi:TRAP transporter small permease [Pollutimonas bauzanensis]|uniref:TRAP transporter small permease subunit n=1 Tax=Pollutimonas bauzanensis TaxID=658167 RepID=UPI0033400F47
MSTLLDGLDRLLKRITQSGCLAAGWALVILSIVIALNVMARKLFNYSIQGVDEYGGYCLAICASIGFSQAAYDKAHVRITVITDHLPERSRAYCDVFALLLLTFTAALLASKSFDVAATSYAMQALATSSLRTPLVLPQAAWAASLCWFSLVLFIQLMRACTKLAHHDWKGVSGEYGASSVDEEIEHELAMAKARLGADKGKML